jgi:hypothetical protein
VHTIKYFLGSKEKPLKEEDLEVFLDQKEKRLDLFQTLQL